MKVTHEEVRKACSYMETTDAYFGEYKEQMELFAKYINQQEKMEEMFKKYRDAVNEIERLRELEKNE